MAVGETKLYAILVYFYGLAIRYSHTLIKVQILYYFNSACLYVFMEFEKHILCTAHKLNSNRTSYLKGIIPVVDFIKRDKLDGAYEKGNS